MKQPALCCVLPGREMPQAGTELAGERAALRREGHLRESTWATGEWADDLIYGLFRDEWDSRTR
jgi:hypothetical protein